MRLIPILILATLIVFVVLAIYLIHFYDRPWSDEPSEWGAFGEFIGGIIGTVLAAANLIVLIRLTMVVSERDDQRLLGQIRFDGYQHFISHVRLLPFKRPYSDVCLRNDHYYRTVPLESLFLLNSKGTSQEIELATQLKVELLPKGLDIIFREAELDNVDSLEGKKKLERLNKSASEYNSIIKDIHLFYSLIVTNGSIDKLHRKYVKPLPVFTYDSLDLDCVLSGAEYKIAILINDVRQAGMVEYMIAFVGIRPSCVSYGVTIYYSPEYDRWEFDDRGSLEILALQEQLVAIIKAEVWPKFKFPK